MVIRFIFIALLVFSLFIESSVFPFPLVVLFSLLFFLFFDEMETYIIIFVFCLLLDSFMLHAVGYTALFLFAFMSVVIILEKLFTIKLNMPIVAGIIILGVEGYRQYAHYPFLFGTEAILVIGLLFSVIIQKQLSAKGGLLHGQKEN